MPARFALRVFSFEVPMPVPTTLASLSTTAASNSPGGGENPFPDLDDHIRAGYAFDAQNRDAIATKLNASAVSAFGLTLIDDADAATARATLGAAGLGANTFTGAQTLPGNASSALQAVPKQQAESIAAAAVVGYERLTQIAAKPSTSGTSVTFSGADGVPAWAKRVTVSLDLVSTNGADQVCVSLGTSGGIDKAGYQGSSCFIGTGGGVAATIGAGGATLPLTSSSATRSGRVVFENVGANVWAFSGQVGDTSAGNVILVAGRKDLGAALTQLAVTTINGTDAFDGGQVTVIYEG